MRQNAIALSLILAVLAAGLSLYSYHTASNANSHLERLPRTVQGIVSSSLDSRVDRSVASALRTSVSDAIAGAVEEKYQNRVEVREFELVVDGPDLKEILRRLDQAHADDCTLRRENQLFRKTLNSARLQISEIKATYADLATAVNEATEVQNQHTLEERLARRESNSTVEECIRENDERYERLRLLYVRAIGTPSANRIKADMAALADEKYQLLDQLLPGTSQPTLETTRAPTTDRLDPDQA